jgi:hypothetical protein
MENIEHTAAEGRVILIIRLLVVSLLAGLFLMSQDVQLIDVAVRSLQLWRYLIQQSGPALMDLISTIALGAIFVLPLWFLDRLCRRYFS